MLQQETEQKLRSQLVSTASKKLEELLDGALKKVGAKTEKDICRYLPNNGGYMHHFTYRKLKTRNPDALSEMLRRYIINSEKPMTVAPKQRAARGSKKKKDHVVLSAQEMDRVFQLAKNANDLDLMRRLLPKKDFKSVKKELLHCIKKNIVNHALWTCFVEGVEHSSKMN